MSKIQSTALICFLALGLYHQSKITRMHGFAVCLAMSRFVFSGLPSAAVLTLGPANPSGAGYQQNWSGCKANWLRASYASIRATCCTCSCPLEKATAQVPFARARRVLDSLDAELTVVQAPSGDPSSVISIGLGIPTIEYTYPQLPIQMAANRPGSNLNRQGGSIFNRRRQLVLKQGRLVYVLVTDGFRRRSIQ